MKEYIYVYIYTTEYRGMGGERVACAREGSVVIGGILVFLVLLPIVLCCYCVVGAMAWRYLHGTDAGHREGQDVWESRGL